MLKKVRRRKRITLTPLVDVIFLLLLFFMLTSTFSRFSEVPLSTAGGGGNAQETPPLFLQLFPERLTLNGAEATLAALPIDRAQPQTLLVALQPEVTAQRLTDLLVALRHYPTLTVTVLGSS